MSRKRSILIAVIGIYTAWVILVLWVIPMFAHSDTNSINANTDEIITSKLQDYLRLIIGATTALLAAIITIIGIYGKQYFNQNLHNIKTHLEGDIFKTIEASINKSGLDQKIITLLSLLKDVEQNISNSHKNFELKESIEKAIIENNEYAKSYADSYISILYNTHKSDPAIIEFCRNYENSPYTLNNNSWFYYALSSMNFYSESHSELDMARALKGCENSLLNNPDQGKIYAVLASVHTITYIQYEDENKVEEKKNAKEEILKVFENALRNNRGKGIVPAKMYEYLMLEDQPQWMIDLQIKMFQLFPKEFNAIQHKYNPNLPYAEPPPINPPLPAK